MKCWVVLSRRPWQHHAYNLLTLGPGTAAVSYLYPMLEGQVAVLSSGLVTADAAANIFTALFDGPLYRPDQQSFMLYPDRALPGFMARNAIPPQDQEALL